MEKSPAESAGIRTGDVIVKFNGDEVTSVRKLTRLIGEVDPDHQATLTVFVTAATEVNGHGRQPPRAANCRTATLNSICRTMGNMEAA